MFLPVMLLVFAACRRLGRPKWAVAALLLGSAAFYLAWSWRDGAVLLGSILFNYAVGQRQAAQPSKGWLSLAVIGNLAVLVYFKYAAFFLAFLPDTRAWQFVLPLGISFFTFQQIAWQVDLYQRRITADSGLARYALFVSFFPQLIAGPIVHARTIIPKLTRAWLARPLPWTLGVSLLCVGLAKKVLLADSLAPGVDALFNAAAGGQALDALQVLSAAFGYGLQLYFDFSGYADMAIGLGLLFGLRLPTNFRAPYRSVSVVEFWRRWHITLSHFLRDYLYTPLGGNKVAPLRRSFNLTVTMLLGGLWHGAGWQFVVWGGLHGLMLAVVHAWRRAGWMRIPAWLAWSLTLCAVMLAWVPFRAASLDVALAMYGGLLTLPSAFSFPTLDLLLTELARQQVVHCLIWVIPPLLLIATIGRNSLQWCLRLGDRARGAVSGVLMLMVLKALAERPDRAFLYFNF